MVANANATTRIKLPMTIETYLEMQDELSAMFGGREVDLTQKRLLKNPFRRHEILKTRQVVYGE